jgi:hypothetical protein
MTKKNVKQTAVAQIDNNSDSSDTDLSDNEYLVEKIVEKRFKAKRVEYLIKWKGFSE